MIFEEGRSGELGLAVVSWVRVGLALAALATVAMQTIFGGDNRPDSWFGNVARVGPGAGAQTGSQLSKTNVRVYTNVCLGNAHFVPGAWVLLLRATLSNQLALSQSGGLLNSWEMFTLFHVGLPVHIRILGKFGLKTRFCLRVLGV